MQKNQKGFSVGIVLMAILVVGLIGFVGWSILGRSDSAPSNASSTTQPTEKASQAVPKEQPQQKQGWKTVEENGLSISYPVAWDNVEEPYYKLTLDGIVSEDTFYKGFGSPFGYKHLGGENWEYVDSEGKKVDDTKPQNAPAEVIGADSTVIVGAGDGGCGGRKIGFAYRGGIYTVSLPWQCDPGSTGSAGLDAEIVDKDLEEVIGTIRVIE